MNLLEVCRLVDEALNEDIGSGDITTDAVIDPNAIAKGKIVSRAKGVVAGIPVAGLCFRRLDARVSFEQLVEDGAKVSENDVLAQVSGPAASILKAERVALNFTQHLSGIASLTARFVQVADEYNVQVLDTRKTTPGLRMLEKYAVRAGGGFNHRFGLYDGILIKDNHLQFRASTEAAPSALAAAVIAARQRAGHLQKVEVEAETLEQVRQAVRAGADAILLDNMNSKTLAEAVALVRKSKKQIFLEASGNISLRNIHRVAAAGVDAVSIGALTHSAPILDIALELTPAER